MEGGRGLRAIGVFRFRGKRMCSDGGAWAGILLSWWKFFVSRGVCGGKGLAGVLRKKGAGGWEMDLGRIWSCWIVMRLSAPTALSLFLFFHSSNGKSGRGGRSLGADTSMGLILEARSSHFPFFTKFAPLPFSPLPFTLYSYLSHRYLRESAPGGWWGGE